LKRKKVPFFMPLLLIMLSLNACGDQRVLENLGLIQTVSYDLLPGGQLDISVSIPQADPETSSDREVLSAAANSSKEAKMIMSRKTGMLLVSGQIRNVLFGESLARSGLKGHLDALIRDPSISSQIKISVVDGNAGELLRDNYEQHPRTGRYIDMLLEKESQGQTIPKVTLFNFQRDYFDEGVDPIAPMIRKQDSSFITTNGIALFRDDKHVARIEPKDSLVFAFLKGKFREGEISIDLTAPGASKEVVMFSSITSSRKIKVAPGTDGAKKIKIEVDITGSVLEYLGDLKLSNERERRLLEDKVSHYISKRADTIVSLMKEHKLDNLGIGRYVRNRVGFKQWQQMKWREEIPKLEIECSIHVKIKDYGKFR